MIYRSGWLGALALLLSPAQATESAPRSTEALAFNCYTCHAPNLQRKGKGMPSLQGQSAEKLLHKLQAFRNGEDGATIMNRIAKGYSDEELTRIAGYLADDLAKIRPAGK